MDTKHEPPDAPVSNPSTAIAEEDGESIAEDYTDENALLTNHRYRSLDHGFRSVGEINQDFRIRRRVTRQASFLRDDSSATNPPEKSPEKPPVPKDPWPGIEGDTGGT